MSKKTSLVVVVVAPVVFIAAATTVVVAVAVLVVVGLSASPAFLRLIVFYGRTWYFNAHSPAQSAMWVPPPPLPMRPSPASRSTINTVACSRMSVSAHPLTMPSHVLRGSLLVTAPWTVWLDSFACCTSALVDAVACWGKSAWRRLFVHFLCCNLVAQIMHKPMKHASDHRSTLLSSGTATPTPTLNRQPQPTWLWFVQRFLTLCANENITRQCSTGGRGKS